MTDHPEHAGLLRDVLQRPGDDTPRLILADWYEDHGEAERAEFVRVQCELARLLAGIDARHHNSLDMILDPQDAADQAWKHQVWGLRRRERKLLAANQAAWRAALPAGWANWVTDFRRGFVAEVRLPLAAFTAHAEALARACPLEAVTLTDKAPGTALAPDRYWNVPGCGGCVCDIPLAIGRFLRPRRVSGDVRVCGDEAEARADLSAACVRYARRLAGLPELEVIRA